MAVNWIASVGSIVIALAHLAGLIVAVVLLVRKKGSAAVLASIAFGLLFLVDVARLLRFTVLDRILLTQAGFGQAQWAMTGTNCCCSLFDVAGIALLIAALWTALRSVLPERKVTISEE